jgi:hypothetical protein
MRLALLTAALALTACDQLYVEAQVPNLCQHLAGQRFTVPPEVRAQYALLPPALTSAYELDKSFEFDVSVQVPSELQHLESRFTLTSVRITAVAPTTDFGFLQSASVTLEAPTAAGLAPHAIEYQRTTAHPTELVWSGDNFDLSPYLATGTLRYTVAMVGTLPDGDVAADIEVCASAAVKLNYLQQ